MSWDIVEKTIKQQNPELETLINWQDIDAALAIMFTKTNGGDLHMDVRNARKINQQSHKTHIDLTSGNDIDKGLCPINDFFKSVTPATYYSTQMSQANLKRLGAKDIDVSEPLINSSIKVTKISPRNSAKNASAQLTEKNDILPLRKVIDVGQSIILLRRKDHSLYAIGVDTSSNLILAMKGKTKRMFLAEHNVALQDSLEHLDEVLTDVNSEPDLASLSIDGLDITTINNANGGQGRVQNQEIKKAIELRGMEVTNNHFNVHGYKTSEVHIPFLANAQGLIRNPGYDILANAINTYRIEVKATTSNGSSVMLSVNELEAAIKDPKEVCLAVVSNIKIKMEDNKFIGNGGDITLYRWKDIEEVNKKLNELQSLIDTFSSTGITLVKNSITCQVKIESVHLEEFLLEKSAKT